MKLPSSLPLFRIDDDLDFGQLGFPVRSFQRSGKLSDLSIESLVTVGLFKIIKLGETTFYTRNVWFDHTCADCDPVESQPRQMIVSDIASDHCLNSTFCPIMHHHNHVSNVCRVIEVRRNNRKRLRADETSAYASHQNEDYFMNYSGLELQTGFLFGEPVRPAVWGSHETLRERVFGRALGTLLDTVVCFRDTIFGVERFESKSFVSRFITVKESEDFVVRLVEDLIILIYSLFRSRSQWDRHVALVTFLKLRGSPADFSVAALAANQIFDFVFASDKLEVQSDNFFEDARKCIDSYERVKKLAIFKKTYKFCMFLLSKGICDKVGLDFDYFNYTKCESEAIKRDFSSRPNMVHCILDTVLFYCEIGVQCFKTGTLYPILHSGTSYEKWFDECRRIQRLSLHVSNLEPHGTSLFQFIADLKRVIEQGNSIKSFGVLDDVEKRLVRDQLYKMQCIDSELLTRKKAMEERPAPFSLLFNGPSSVAKSAFMQLCFYHFGRVMKLPLGDEYKYPRTPGVEYWDNFSSNMWCCIIDDAAYKKPGTGVEDTTVAEIIQLRNNVAYVPNQADLANKGRTPFLCKLLMATTNTKHLNASAYYSCPVAVNRRFPYVVTLKLKHQFADEQGMVAPSKMPAASNTDFPDVWRIIVERPVKVEGCNTARFEEIAAFDSIYPYLRWLTERILEHESAQVNAMDTSKKMKEVPVCEKCFLPHAHCKCAAEIFRDIFPDTFPTDSGDGLTESTVESYTSAVGSLFDPAHVAGVSGADQLENALATNDWTWHDIRRAGLNPNLVLQTDNVRSWWFDYVDQSVRNWQASLHEKVDDVRDSFRTVLCVQCRNKEAHECWYAQCHLHWENGLDYYDQGLEDERVIAKSSFYYQLRVGFFLWFVDFMTRYFWICLIVEFFFGGFWKYRLMKYLFWEWESVGIMFRMLGHRFERKIGFTPLMVKLFLFSGSAYVYLKICGYIYDSIFGKKESTSASDSTGYFLGRGECDCSDCGYFMQGDLVSAEIGVTPKPPEIPSKKNVWYYNDPYIVCNQDVTQQSRCLKGESAEKILIRKIHENTARYTAPVDGEKFTNQLSRDGTIVNIGGQIWMTNLHGLPRIPFYISIVRSPQLVCVSSNVKDILVTSSMVHTIPDSDLAFIKLSNIPPGHNLVNYFAGEGLKGVFNGLYIGRERTGGETLKKVNNIRKQFGGFTNTKDGKNIVVDCPVWEGRVESDTIKGTCGSLLVSFGDCGAIILGAHVLGGMNNECVAISVTKELIQAELKFFQDLGVEKGTLPISAPSAPRELGPLHPKSPVLFTQSGSANVFGSFTGFKVKHTSNVKETLICRSVLNRGYKLAHGKPDMSYMPFWHALQDMVKPVFGLNADRLRKVKNIFVRHILDNLSAHDLSTVMVLDDVTAVNGAPGVEYCDKMNRNTSMGVPYRKPKRNFLEPIEGPPGTDFVAFNREVMDRVNEILNTYKDGKLFHPQFCGNLKDEALPFRKCKAQKTRVFCGAECAHCIVARKYYLSLIMLIQRKKFVFNVATGTIAQSLEWEEILDFLIKDPVKKEKIRKLFVAGDFRLFDKQMCAMLILESFDVLISIAKAAGFSELDILIMWCIAYDTAFPTVDFNGDLIQFFGTNPSGHILTVIINGLAHVLYIMYVYDELAPEGCDVNDFFMKVNLITYGDDGLMSVSDDCPWFNHTTISQCLIKYGIQYTMADKEAESVPYIPLEECTFLKRSWRYDPDIGAYVAPLEEGSICKMLTVGVASKTICPEARDIAAISTAVREYFFYGKEIFHQKTKMFREIVDECNLGTWVEKSTFPSWDELRENFWDNSRHVSFERVIV
jgi:hypothetical protein